MAEGHDLMQITCRRCKRVLVRVASNRLVGQQDRLRCKACGARGADIVRYWHVGPLPPGVK
jgi:hypothetical protein